MAARTLQDTLINFSIDLYKKLPVEDGQRDNVIYSPLSIAAALSMLLAGARNDTAKQLCIALHVDLEAGRLHDLFRAALARIRDCGSKVELHVASRVYTDTSFPVLESYLNFLKGHYSSELKSVDFRNDHEKIRLDINSWVEQVTASKIKDLLTEGSVDDSTALALVNAVYFKGLWEVQFLTEATQPWDFRVDLKTTTKVDMMHREGDYRMSRSEELKVQALEIPYQGGKTSMVVLLPDDIEGLSYLEKHLSAEALAVLLQNLSVSSEIQLFLPKFKLEQSIDLEDSLQALGVKDLFTSAADLSGISPKTELRVSKVVHKAFIEVDEKGTEAAAATEDSICCECACEEAEFIVDRPFMFLIRGQDPDLILFMGSVRRP
uniref:Putative serine proteinase inhibitor n=1 Tax=Amblyomma aureolatum TaxID=187763 RepID=A0A1E1XIF8_9ACAR